ncbi:MarR family transcriptional regulator [Agrobacterium vitis]|uniref:MarR family winged helix-turn-helix transcriptional regulator n=1 Tax=Allorhizobium ampelinum TaxID=3025782 RepID=UPI001F2CE4E7|nr:MarR family transcriptional regulator [Allorhizobium ampelinum]MCF1471037.1 MarR family transcriptional regulator [Allorhizobium ampelinum]
MCKTQNDSALPEAGQGKRGEDGYVGYLLRQGANAYRNRVEQVLDDLHLTQPQFSVLTMLAAYPGHSSADMARLSLLTPQTMTVIVANLMKAGLVERRPHPIHGRIQQLDLTEIGHSRLNEAKKRVYTLEKELVSGLSQNDEAVIRRWLVRLAAMASPA